MNQLYLVKDIILGSNNKFPSTRYMGSKRKLLPVIKNIVESLNVTSVLDAFAGSNCVAYELKKTGVRVTTNDFLKFSYHISKAAIENNTEKLTKHDLDLLFKENKKKKSFIRDTFSGLYFSDYENVFLDDMWSNLGKINSDYKRKIVLASMHRACLKRRPRGIFAYTGFRYDDGRKDLRQDLRQHFLDAVIEWNNAVFDNGKINRSYNKDIFDLEVELHDLVYLDPPYFSLKSDNDYTRRYHFVEGLASYWKDAEIDYKTTTKKIKSKDTPFSSKEKVYSAFDELFRRYKKSILLVSYYSNGLPSKDEMIGLIKKYKRNVRVLDITHTYSFGTHNHKIGNSNNKITEYLFIAD